MTNPSTIIMLIGNKSDLDFQRDISYEEASKFAEENGPSFPSSFPPFPFFPHPLISFLVPLS